MSADLSVLGAGPTFLLIYFQFGFRANPGNLFPHSFTSEHDIFSSQE